MGDNFSLPSFKLKSMSLMKIKDKDLCYFWYEKFTDVGICKDPLCNILIKN